MGKYSFSFNHIIDPNKDVYLKQAQVVKAGIHVINDLYELNLSSTDYGNLTISKTVSNLSGIICSCMYTSASTTLKVISRST
jgi:hypothetical protein